MAANAWQQCVAASRRPSDILEARHKLAQALFGICESTVKLRRPLREEDAARAEREAEALLGAKDDRFLEAAASYLVDLAMLRRDDAVRRYQETQGAEGFAERTEPQTVQRPSGEGVVRAPIPPLILRLNAARRLYIDRVPPHLDVNHRVPELLFQAAETLLNYGHLQEARIRFEEIRRASLGTEMECAAWDQLDLIRLWAGESEVARAVANSDKCNHHRAFVPDDPRERPYTHARSAFEAAVRAKSPAARRAAWRRTATLYSAVLDAGPGDDHSPEAAMNGAYAYKQLGEYDKTIGMYQLFIERYGDSKILRRLQNGDPRAKPPVEPNPKHYEERIKFLKDAYQQLAASYVLLFDYQRASQQYDDTSRMAAFPPDARRNAARNAMMLYATLGDRKHAQDARTRLLALGPSAQDKAEADLVFARLAASEWDERGRDEGPNRSARLRAMVAWRKYFDDHRGDKPPSRFVVLAAHKMAAACKAGRDPRQREWHQKTVSAFERFKARGAGLMYEAALAAEAEFSLIDADIRNDAGLRNTAAKSTLVDRYSARLDHVIDTYQSPEWSVAARVRQASLYDALSSSAPAALAVQHYIEAIHLSRTADAYHPMIGEATRHLAALTQQLGNDRMRSIAAQVRGFVYTDDMFLRGAAGLHAEPRGGELPLPLPMFVSN
ncbi:MAG: hypothetical protein HY898_20945 [Deltaproteobacteria bacterium]|nr:hypothetical protein [Deltaproteobacteria bacterium]